MAIVIDPNNLIPKEFYEQNPFCQKYKTQTWSDLKVVQEWLDSIERAVIDNDDNDNSDVIQKTKEHVRVKR